MTNFYWAATCRYPQGGRLLEVQLWLGVTWSNSKSVASFQVHTALSLDESFATFEKERRLGRTNFRKDFCGCYHGQGKNWLTWQQQERRLKNEFAFFQSLSQLFLLTSFVKCGRTLLKLNSKGSYPSSEREMKFRRCLFTFYCSSP